MSSTGSKGPTDTSGMARVLQFRRAETVQGPLPTKEVAPTEVSTESTEQGEKPAAIFEHVPGQGTQLSAPVEGAALSQLIARLKARSGDAEVTTVGGPTFVQTSEGKVLSGSLWIESKAGIQKLEGVVRAGGDIAVTGILKNGDLLVLRDLRTIEGRLTFEGVRSKLPTD